MFSFECNNDYIYDVEWSPSHPAVFGCVNGVGQLQLWDINKDSEVITATPHILMSSHHVRFPWLQRMWVIP